MDKKLLTTISLLILVLAPSLILFYFKDQILPKKENLNVELSNEIQNESKEILEVEQNDIDIEHENEFANLNPNDKIAHLRKTFFIKGLVIKGDNYINSNAPLLALNQYLKAYANNPEDKQVILKIANTYYDLKNFKKSLEYYEKIKNDLNEVDLEKYILNNFYNLNQKDKQSYDLAVKNITEIKNIDEENKYYYLNSLSCLEDFHLCKKSFQEYIGKNKELGEKISNIMNAIKNYEAFQSENLYYKDSLIIAEFFKDELYPISNFLGLGLLKNKPNYKPILLIIGKGYYELGDIGNSKKYLEDYYKLEPNDANIAYLLGNLSFKSRDYTTSNLYYNAALKNNFKNSLDLKRKIVYNNYMIGEKKSIFKSFDVLVDDENSNIDDYSLAIYNTIIEKEINKAIEISNKGLKKFDENSGVEILYGYLGWIYREKNQNAIALEYLEKGLKINPNHPLLTLNMGYLLFLNKEYFKANIYFKKTINMTQDGEFYNLATKKIEEIEAINKAKNENN